jgi:hypothetical protein
VGAPTLTQDAICSESTCRAVGKNLLCTALIGYPAAISGALGRAKIISAQPRPGGRLATAVPTANHYVSPRQGTVRPPGSSADADWGVPSHGGRSSDAASPPPGRAAIAAWVFPGAYLPSLTGGAASPSSTVSSPGRCIAAASSATARPIWAFTLPGCMHSGFGSLLLNSVEAILAFADFLSPAASPSPPDKRPYLASFVSSLTSSNRSIVAVPLSLPPICVSLERPA